MVFPNNSRNTGTSVSVKRMRSSARFSVSQRRIVAVRHIRLEPKVRQKATVREVRVCECFTKNRFVTLNHRFLDFVPIKPLLGGCQRWHGPNNFWRS